MSNDSDFPSGEPLLGEPMRVSAVMVEPMTSNPACAATVVTEQVVVPAVAAPEIGAPPVVEPDESAPASAVVETAATFVPLTPRWVRRSYARSVAPDSIVATLVGLFVLLVGLLAVTRGGIDGPMDTPVVSVLGFTHTTTLGLDRGRSRWQLVAQRRNAFAKRCAVLRIGPRNRGIRRCSSVRVLPEQPGAREWIRMADGDRWTDGRSRRGVAPSIHAALDGRPSHLIGQHLRRPLAIGDIGRLHVGALEGWRGCVAGAGVRLQ